MSGKRSRELRKKALMTLPQEGAGTLRWAHRRLKKAWTRHDKRVRPHG